jgi:outer membrane receptor protein involved in Fe transport
MAQEAEPTETEEFVDEITVTGSLIPRPTLESMSPVSVLEPEQITYSGVTRIEDLVRQLPQIFSQQNSTIANGATGTATVDLRNMGAQRTLVLINGRRTVPGDAWAISTDLNFIPAALVKRVDVLTGGASSVYGADAVTGVVNFVLDTDFEGLRGGIQWTAYQHNNSNRIAQAMNEEAGFPYPSGNTLDGENMNINLAFGSKFADGKGHASIYFDYRNTESLTKAARDYLNCSPGFGSDGPECSGSGTIPQGRFWAYDRDWNYRGSWWLQPDGTIAPGGPRFNYGPFNHMQRPDRKYSAGAFVNYKFNEHVDVYGEVMFMDDYSEAQIAPSADFGNTSVINCDNPMMSEQMRQILCYDAGFAFDEYANVQIGRRSIETGPRTQIYRHTNWRLLAGVRGDINDQWSYDFYGMYAEMSSPQEYIGDLSITRMTDALDVIGDPDDPSTWQCRSGNAGCVPWNVFQYGGVTEEAGNYIIMNMAMTSGVRTQLINGTLTGDLEDYGLKLPAATEGIQIALGTEFRAESLYVHPDDNWENGNASGQGGPTNRVNGRYSVKELFLETLIPVVQDTSGAKDLSFELGFRYSDYSTVGGQSTWKAQTQYAPADAVKFRMGFARAIRAPNVRDLFAPLGLGLAGSVDPCAGSSPSFSAEQCARTGMSPAQYGNVPENTADQYNSFGGGNPNLDPETADTLTFGVVLTPPSVPGLSVAFDYYDIEIADNIGYIDPDVVVSACAATGDPYLCGRIHRDAAGSLWLLQGADAGYTETVNDNIGTVYGEGIDLNISYLASLGEAGFLNTTLTGTYMLANRLVNPALDYDCVGYYGNDCAPYPTPEWRHLARFSWETNFDWVFSLGWRYITAVTIDDAQDSLYIGDPGMLDTHRINGTYKNPSFNYFDLAFSWNISDQTQLVFGCNNLFDKEPPLAPNMNDNDYGPGFYGFYDPYGRFVHAAIHFDF